MIQPTGLRRRWTREELLLAMHLYYRIPFGRQHSRAPEVVGLAKWLDRTPGSVAMKLNNFTSLDPSEAERGVRGLPGASSLDQQIWNEFHESPEVLAAQSEALWESMEVTGKPYRTGDSIHQPLIEAPLITKPSEDDDSSEEPIKSREGVIARGKWVTEPRTGPEGPTDGERTLRVRYAQRFFRRAVLSAYNVQCCISGNPVPQLLIASHILPWTPYPEHRINPRNGLCLSRLHDAAFDQYLITLDEDYRLVLSKSLNEFAGHEAIHTNFIAFEGKSICLPEKFLPDPAFLAIHREKLVD